jgi:hypothetical protein
MQRIMSYCAPRNTFIADKIRFCENFREMKVFWTAFTPMSEGTEKFVENYLPIIRFIFKLIFSFKVRLIFLFKTKQSSSKIYFAERLC